MPDQTTEPLTDDYLRHIVNNPYTAFDRTHGQLAAELLELRTRVAELEAAQRPQLGYVVGWQHEGRTLLAFDELEVGILGDRARAYTDLGHAHQFLAEVAPEDPRTRFCVYELREATP